jgi:hypothetical protein
MTTQPIDESGMKFGPYPDGHCFATAKTWALPANAVTVINDGLARRYGLIA